MREPKIDRTYSRADVARPRRRKPSGSCLHYDGSVSDKGGLAWLMNPEFKLGYDFYIWDDGTIFELNPNWRTHRMPHCGRSRQSHPILNYPEDMGNAALIGIALAAGGKANDKATPAQRQSVIELVAWIASEMGWDLVKEPQRTTSHKFEAWPRGRKVDVEGNSRNMVLDTRDVRQAVIAMFQSQSSMVNK